MSDYLWSMRNGDKEVLFTMRRLYQLTQPIYPFVRFLNDYAKKPIR